MGFQIGFPALRNYPSPYDTDALAWINAVEEVDGQPLETAVKDGVNAFVVGCKRDGIWTPIKACVLLGGARTRTGAMTPLVGAAPTSFVFANGDYSRQTGLKGGTQAEGKYLLSNRNNNADPQDSKHMATWKTGGNTVNGSGGLIGTISTAGGASWLFDSSSANSDTMRINRTASTTGLSFPATGFVAASRGAASSFVRNYNGTSTTVSSATSATPSNDTLAVFRSAGAQYFDGRLAFYSIGEDIDLDLLYARVDALMTVFAAI